MGVTGTLKSEDTEGKGDDNHGNVKGGVDQHIRREIEDIFDCFMELSDDDTSSDAAMSCESSYDSQTIDFGTDIQSDGMGPSTLLNEEGMDDSSQDSEADTQNASAESSNLTDEKKERCIAAAKVLQKVGDELNKEYIVGNKAVQKSLQNVTGQMLVTGIDHIFEKSLDQVLNDFNTYQEDKYKVALIMLCTRQVVRTMKKTAGFTETIGELVRGTAMDYLTARYPDWRSY